MAHVLSEHEAIEERIRRYFAEDPRGVVAVYLFGSRARGTARKTSDVDIGILREGEPAPGFAGLPLDIEGDLEKRLGLPVQVVDLATAPADLVHRVFRDGKLLLDRGRSRRIEFEVRRRNEYFDLLPILEEYRRGAARTP